MSFVFLDIQTEGKTRANVGILERESDVDAQRHLWSNKK